MNCTVNRVFMENFYDLMIYNFKYMRNLYFSKNNKLDKLTKNQYYISGSPQGSWVIDLLDLCLKIITIG